MGLRICIYEDHKLINFYPLTLLRPVYTLHPGAVPLFRRAEFMFPGASITLVARDQISPLLAEQFPDYPVSIIKRETGADVLFLNGRVRSYGELPDLVRDSRLSTIFKSNGETVAVLFKVDITKSIIALATHQDYIREYQFHKNEIPEFETTATMYNHLWEMVDDLESVVTEDIGYLKGSAGSSASAKVLPGAYMVNPEQVFLGDNVQVCPGAVIDATKGPVMIEPNTRVESHASIYGPSYIGANSVILAGKIAQCSVGHTCRVGGELEVSILQPHVNKYHAGFIGHSVVGSWVNFGAMTTNSDLKNNYSPIRVSVNGKMVDTGSIKVGSFIGDHTKFGIGTLLNTGINIGICCNIFGGGLTTDKEIPPFRWGNTDRWHLYSLEKAIDTAQRTAERRNLAISPHELTLFKLISESQHLTDGALTF